MKSYELTYIISSAITNQEADTLKTTIEAFIQSKEGVILKSIKTTPQMLAYPIKKQSSGYFITLEFQSKESHIKELQAALEKESPVLRHFIVVKKPVKVMKARRTRKPLAADVKPATAAKPSKTTPETIQTPEEKVELGDIDKKLDEILSE
jgi:small subunit ribosomal protein S6